MSTAEIVTGESSPSPARVRDFWLGGQDNYEADRAAAERIQSGLGPPAEGHLPDLAECAVRARLFLGRAVEYAALQGARQVIDLRCGLPVPPRVRLGDGRETVLRNSHQAARDGAGGARCAYVDDDPRVLSHVRALLAEPGRVAAVEADWRDPAAVLSSRSLAEVIDLRRPVTLALGMALHHLPAGEARELTKAYLDRVAPGSFLIVSVSQAQPAAREAIAAAWPWKAWFHPASDVASFIGGCEYVPPGLVVARAWRPGWQTSCMVPDGPVWALAGVGIKP